MESAMKIRRLVLVEGRSIRSVSRDAGISRNTLKKYLRVDEPPAYKRTAPVSQHKLKDHETTLRQWFEFDLTRPKRERRTAQKLYEQLMLEGYPGSYSPVCRFIKKLKATHGTNYKAFIPEDSKYKPHLPRISKYPNSDFFASECLNDKISVEDGQCLNSH